MLTQPITIVGPPTFPAGVRYIQNGDALNTGNHQLNASDVADALGNIQALKAPLAAPALTGAATAVNLTVSGVLVSSGTTTLSSTNTLSGSTTISGITTLSGSTTVSGATSITSAITRSGASATWADRVGTATDSAQDFTTSLDYVRIPDVSANRDYLLPTVATAGMSFVVSRLAFAGGFDTRYFTTDRSTSANIVGVITGSAAGWIHFVYTGTVWTAYAWGGNATSLA